MRELRHRVIIAYLNFKDKRRKPDYIYIYFGGQRPFKVGEILRSNGNGYKTISYGEAKIVEEFKATRFRKFVDRHPKFRKFLQKLGFKFRIYDYKCVSL